MKISSLNIKNYKQFQNLELTLTYPKGHEKAGQPLDKICIIGQSGTGKTNLLNIIKKSIVIFSKNSEDKYTPFREFAYKNHNDSYIISRFIANNRLNYEAYFTAHNFKITEKMKWLDCEKIYFVGTNKIDYTASTKPSVMSKIDKSLIAGLQIDKDKTIMGMFQDRNIELVNIIDQKILNIKNKYNLINDSINNFTDNYIIEVNKENDNSWDLIKDKIDARNDKFSIYNNKCTNRLLVDDSYSKDDYRQDIKNWENENENILEKISIKLNAILNKFNLELTKLDKNQKSYRDLIIKDLSNDKIIPYDDLSTGTKNLISTFIPLKMYKPEKSIILIDEPEISFYPDIQTKLTDLYMDVGINNQLIVATHSPMIASSFEPWEVVELCFDNDNQIYRKSFFKGDNHIDNYFLDPRLLTWTNVLTDIFLLQEDSNFTFREKKLIEYIKMEKELQNTKDDNEKINKFNKLMKLSNLLGLSGNEAN